MNRGQFVAHLRKDLESLARCSNYAIIGPAGWYLRTLPLVSYEPLFSKANRIEVVSRQDVPCKRVDLGKIGLAGFEDGFIRNASCVRFDGGKVKVASPPYLAFEYLVRGRSRTDIATFVMSGGNIEPEMLRSLLKAAKRPELFDEVPEILYDFSPSR